MVQQEGVVDHIIYRADDGFSVVELRTPDSDPFADTFKAVGVLPEVSCGMALTLTGKWTTHNQYGRQFQVKQCEVELPATIPGIENYLGSTLIDGVGPSTAKAIVEHFGTDTLDVLDEEPERLEEVDGVGPMRAEAIAEAWEEQKEIRKTMMFLHGYGISTALATKVHEEYGAGAAAMVQDNPYQLARDIHGVGFKKADGIAQKLGLPFDSPSRIQAGILYALEEQTGHGHTYARREELIAEATEILELPKEDVAPQLNVLVDSQDVVREDVPTTCDVDDAIYPPALHHCETNVAQRIRSIVAEPPLRFQSMNETDWDIRLGRAERDTGISLTDEQREAVKTALTNKVTVLTGGPGTGKTVTVQTIIKLLEWRGMDYALCAPTGRAAKRLSEATEQEAQTIHRLLEYAPPNDWGCNWDNPLKTDAVIVDEASMADITLAYRLLDAVRNDTRVIFVGDVNQLPSVGAGDVLRDLIASGHVAVVRLTEIFRQAADSGIVVNAHRINGGDFPTLNSDRFDDFYFFGKSEPDEAASLLVDIVKRRIPKKFALYPDEIQVLAPMYRGTCGIDRLNTMLQEKLNPQSPLKPERKLKTRTFRQGDRVMQTRNDYNKDVYNGDIGQVKVIDAEEKIVTVVFDGRGIDYKFDELGQLVLAYAISIHKSQGSEYPAVVVPILTQHYIMLQRNLLYTAITRAKELVVLVGTKKAIGMAVGNDEVRQRNSGLAQRLQAAKIHYTPKTRVGPTRGKRREPAKTTTKAPVKLSTEVPQEAWRERAAQFADHCAGKLFEDDNEGLEHLHARGLTDDTIRAWGLGWHGKAERADEWRAQGITIPWQVDGEIWHIRVRRFDDRGPKYIHIPGGEPTLYGFDRMKNKYTVVICEGELDAALLWQEAGDLVDVVALGTKNQRLNPKALARLSGATRWFLALNNDADDKADEWEEWSARVRRIQPIDGNDITDFHQAGGNLRVWIEYYLDR